MKQNWFDTLNQTLESEGILHMWDCMFPPINYSETRTWTYDDGSKYGHYISIYRNENGRYERPVHYAR
jgi:ArsR family metal-binding transcriptional regulator